MHGNEQPGREQPDREHSPAAGSTATATPTEMAPASSATSGRLDTPQVDGLERVDVGDDAREQVTAAIAVELRWSERNDPLVEPRARRTEHAQREVVRGEAFGVAAIGRPSPKKRTPTITTISDRTPGVRRRVRSDSPPAPSDATPNSQRQRAERTARAGAAAAPGRV